MALRRRNPSRARSAAALVVLALSCQSVLGIEDLSTTPRESAPESTASAGAGGSLPIGAAGSTGTAEQPAGLDVPGAGGAGDDGAALGDAGPALGDAATNDAGVGLPPSIVVGGRVIDFYRRPVPNVPVSIGEQSATTDADGRFSLAEVTPPYELRLVLDFARDGVPARYGYVYQDLTRTDPTLQVYTALQQRSVDSLDLSFDIPEPEPPPGPEPPPTRAVIFGFSSPDTEFADGSLESGAYSILGGLSWGGPVVTTGNAHALLVSRPGGADAPGSAPFAYEAHQATPLTAVDDTVAAIGFTIEPGGALEVGTISGQVSGDTLGDRSNVVALRFADGTALPLIEDNSAGEAFGYLVPSLPDASVTLAVSQGFFAPYAVAWREVAAGQAGLELALPSPVRLDTPQPDAVVTPETRFSWSSPSGGARTFLVHVELIDDTIYQGMFIATSRTEIELPRFGNALTLPPRSTSSWSVETHGDLPDVDAMTGPDGFLDAFSIPPQTYPYGPRRGSGSYTDSTQISFTMED
jgi:hypothetical protein